MSRISIKIVGAQGQGVNSVGEMCAKGLKRAGYCVFGEREYMSVIMNGHSSYQLEISNEKVRSTQEKVDVLVTFNHHGIKKDLKDIKENGILIHQTPQWKFGEEDQKFIDVNSIKVIYLPTEDILKKLNAKPVLGNVLITSVVWSLIERSSDELKEMVRERFGHKKDLLALNYLCIDEGVKFSGSGSEKVCLPEPDEKWKSQLLITGSQAMGLGAIHAGCRALFGYPMTPASPLLTFLAEIQGESKMLVKQAEDEITAVQMMVGAMHAGTRAMTATSGGGYDLMTETISLCGISETPAVIVLAQRPGPGTGLPTWTAQGDLLMAVSAGHGEFPRAVMSVSDAEDSFSLMMDAFNFSEEFQIPVTVLTEKQIAESLFTTEISDQKSVVRRGRLVEGDGLKLLRATDRYDPDAPDGVSARWLPGSDAPTYCAQSYEHNADGSFDESAENAIAQAKKRMKKMEGLKRALPEPEYFGSENTDVLIVSWGSNKNAILDLIEDESVAYLHYTYLWPLKTERLVELAAKAKKTVLVEGNVQGQLGMLIKQECGLEFNERVLKFDGRATGLSNLNLSVL